MTTEWQAGLQAFREGRMREAMDRLQSASREAERSVSLQARFQTYAFLGAAQYALGRPAEAVASFEAALRLNPTPTLPADLTVNLANAYLAVGRRDEARRMLQQTLAAAPGHIEARMLLQRIDALPEGSDANGLVLGESPASIKRYLRSLIFKTVATEGYDPSQVRQAFLQIEHYVDFLIAQIAHSERALAQSQQEVARLQQTEESLVQNLLEAQQELERLRQQSNASGEGNDSENTGNAEPANISPLERLFQRKS